jgi:N-succinyl-L-ornithine transcarbamylase
MAGKYSILIFSIFAQIKNEAIAIMRNFTSVKDIDNMDNAIKMAFELKKEPFKYVELGKNKTIVLIFFDSSLRTRLSTQKAAMNLGMNVMVLDINKDGWKLETQMGVIMDGDKPEHIREAVPVIGQYCDMIGVRSFARYESKEEDYGEMILNQFIQYSGVPVISMESATRHPLQSFADLLTIEQYKTKKRPKVVLSWAPHPRALPQAVPNSFAEWMIASNVDFVITQPEGYELAKEFTNGARIEYNQDKAFEGADFIYAKNWASYNHYGQILSKDRSWTVTEDKMKLTNHAKFMHCLPVRRNMIVADAVIDGPDSIVIEEAANRVVSAQTVIKMILERK